MKKQTQPLPSYRFGAMVKYMGDKEAKFVPACQVGMHGFFDQFRNQYWTNLEEATEALETFKTALEGKAKEGSKLIQSKDPALAERMREGMCSQEDTRLPYYEAVSKAFDAVRCWEWVKDFVVGPWKESDSVYRLNTLPGEDNKWSRDMEKEIEQKLKWFGSCCVGWSCLGHTRAIWQTEAVCSWVRKAHSTWKVANRGSDCVITL